MSEKGHLSLGHGVGDCLVTLLPRLLHDFAWGARLPLELPRGGQVGFPQILDQTIVEVQLLKYDEKRLIEFLSIAFNQAGSHKLVKIVWKEKAFGVLLSLELYLES